MESIILITIVILITFAIFMIGRSVVLWYFRINEVVDLLMTLVSNTKKDISK